MSQPPISNKKVFGVGGNIFPFTFLPFLFTYLSIEASLMWTVPLLKIFYTGCRKIVTEEKEMEEVNASA